MNNDNIYTVLGKILSEEASDSDKRMFNEWIDANEANSDIYLTLKTYWNQDTAGKEIDSLESSYQSIAKRIRKEKRKKIRTITAVLFTLSAVATILLFFFSPFTFKTPQEEYVFEFKTSTKIDTITLPDQTVVILNEFSRIFYSKNFNTDHRIIYIEGEAFFDVSKNPSLPFTIKLPLANEIRVLGTRFNVKSYMELNDIEVNLLEGSLQFQNEKNQIILSPNQGLIFNKENQEIKVNEFDPEYSLFWLKGNYKYQSVTAEKLLEILSKIFEENIQIQNTEILQTTISGTIDKSQSLEDILSIISRSLPFKWMRTDNGILIY